MALFELAPALARGAVRTLSRKWFGVRGTALRKSAILSSDAIAISVVRDREIVWASPGLEAMFGYEPGQLAGKPTRILHASEKSYSIAQTQHVPRAARGETVREEVRLVRSDGEMVWVNLTGTLLDAATGETMWVFANTTAQKTAEERLSIHKAFLLHKGALAQVGGWHYDVRADTLEWSDQTCRLHDVPPGYCPTLEKAFGFYTPESAPVLERAIRRGLSTGEPWDLELALVSAIGRPLWIRVTGEAEWEDGEIVRLIGAFQDVTERRKIARELAQAHELNRATLRSIVDAVIMTDMAGIVLWMNPAAERLTGWEVGEAIGQALHDVCPLVEASTRLRWEPSAPIENQILIARGRREFAIDGTLSPMFGDERNEVGQVFTFRDVTRQRQLLAEIRTREQKHAEALARLDVVFRNSPDSMVLARRRPDGRFVFEAVNPVWEKLRAKTAAEVIGRLPEECLPPAVAALANQIWDRCVQTREGQLFSFEIGDGDVQTWDALVVPIAGADGTVERLLAHSRDVTHQKVLEARLIRMQRMEAVGQLTAGIAHDFNNLLQAISGSLEILREGTDLDQSALDLLGVAEDAAGNGATLVHNMLAFASKQALNPVILRPSDVFAHLGMVLSTMLGSGIRVGTAVEADCWPVRADAAQLENCLLNLALNARDAMPDGGTVTLRAGNVTAEVAARRGLADGDYVCLAVEDNGSGMSPETLIRAQEPFFTTKGIGKGTGLGLSMAGGFVRQSGGDLRITSTLGRGTAVNLWLPACPDVSVPPGRTAQGQPAQGQPAQGQPAQHLAAHGKARRTVLLVDDDARICRLLTAVLQRDGLEVVTRESGAGALAYLRNAGACDLLVTDQSMPGMTGAELLAAAVMLRPSLPALLITGHDLTNRIHHLPARVTVLRKPFRNGFLLDQVRAMLSLLPANVVRGVPMTVGD